MGAISGTGGNCMSYSYVGTALGCTESKLFSESGYSTDPDECALLCDETESCAYFNVHTSNGLCEGYATCTQTGAPFLELYACPTMYPTETPTVRPTVSLDECLAILPTFHPSEAPTISGVPTSDPTAPPSAQPTTLAPTTSGPTTGPTQLFVPPSASPTATPTVPPTRKPSPGPTGQPSVQPSDSPTYLDCPSTCTVDGVGPFTCTYWDDMAGTDPDTCDYNRQDLESYWGCDCNRCPCGVAQTESPSSDPTALFAMPTAEPTVGVGRDVYHS